MAVEAPRPEEDPYTVEMAWWAKVADGNRAGNEKAVTLRVSTNDGTVPETFSLTLDCDDDAWTVDIEPAVATSLARWILFAAENSA
jgi:hypothetical protein